VHLVGCTIGIYYDVRTYEYEINNDVEKRMNTQHKDFYEQCW